jgi:alpha-1,2-mannosyltransferase
MVSTLMSGPPPANEGSAETDAARRSPLPGRALAASAAVAIVLGAFELASLPPETVVVSDFAVFRAGGALILRGEDPWDRAAQEAAMREVLGAEREGGHLAFLLPPHAATLFVPFAVLPLPAAFALFALLSALALARLIVVLAELAGTDRRLVALVVLGLGPVHATFRLGQLAILAALALAELARAVRDRQDVRAGVFLALLGLKPQFAPALAAYLAGAGRVRALVVAAAATVALALPALVVLGPGAWLRWTSELGALEDAFAVATPPYMTNVRGALARVLGDPERRALVSGLAGVLFAALVASAVALGRRDRRNPGGGVAPVLALGLLFSPHLFFHDLLSWSVPIAVARGGAEARRRWDLLALSAPAALLGASAIEPALGALLPIAPQLCVPLIATTWLVGRRAPRLAEDGTAEG